MCQDGFKYTNLTHRPHILEYVSMDLPLVAVCIVGWSVIMYKLDNITPWAIVAATALTLYLFLHCQYITSMKYRIGTEQLMYQRGLFTMQRDYIEMYRIVDYEEHRTFMQMFLGLKSVTIHACDRTTPNLKIIGIPVETDIIGAIRERVEAAKKAHGVYEIANR